MLSVREGRELCGGAGRDPYVAPVPWRKLLFSGDLGGGTRKRLTVGAYAFDGFFPVVPVVQRALAEAREALQGFGQWRGWLGARQKGGMGWAGYKVVDFHPPDIARLMELFYAAATVDGGVYLGQRLADDLPEPLLGWIPALTKLSVPAKVYSGQLGVERARGGGGRGCRNASGGWPVASRRAPAPCSPTSPRPRASFGRSPLLTFPESRDMESD